MLKRFLGITSLLLLPVAASATTTLIIPAAGTGPGANGSRWETELIVHNASSQPVSLDVSFHTSSGATKAQPFVVGPRTTVTTADAVKNIFGLDSATGAIQIDADDVAASHMAITSRTFNSSSAGMFGQDIPAVNANDAAGIGDLSVLPGPATASDFRFNFGAYALTDATIQWQLLRADGTVAATKSVDYTAGTQFQYNAGVDTLLGATAQDGDVVYATMIKGKAIAYGSSVNNRSGDPTYVPALRARADTHVAFGVDVNEDGTIELKDANNDGVIDQPIDLYTIGFSNYFRVVVIGQNLNNVKFELAEPNPDVLLLGDKGDISWAPTVDRRGSDLVLKLKVTVNGVSEILTIPAHVK